MSLVGTTRDPILEGAVVDWPVAADGTRLRVACWSPESASRGTIVFLNGRTEYIEKYFEFYGDLLGRGHAVATQDWRGQGRSDRPLANRQCGYVDRFESYLTDLQQVFETWIQPNCPPPYRLVAHSMGAHIGLRYLHDHPGSFERAFFTSPMWGLGKWPEPPRWFRTVGGASSAVGLEKQYVPFIGGDYDDANRRFEGNPLTSDRVRFQRMVEQIAADPLLMLGAPTFGWMRAAAESIAQTLEAGWAESIETPVMVCSATLDSVVPPAGHAHFVERMPNAELVVLEGALHELLIEVDLHRDQTLAAIDRFMT